MPPQHMCHFLLGLHDKLTDYEGHLPMGHLDQELVSVIMVIFTHLLSIRIHTIVISCPLILGTTLSGVYFSESRREKHPRITHHDQGQNTDPKIKVSTFPFYYGC